MGYRTLLAYDRGGYDLHYSHWGVDPDELTPETPFGGTPDVEWARCRASDLIDPEGGRLSDTYGTAVDPDPIATDLSFADVCEHVDPLEHETLYVVTPAFDVRTHLVIGFRSVEEGGRLVALVGYDDEADAAYLRGWLAGARAVRDVADLGDDGVVRALRWLDADRGTVVYVGPERET